MNFNHKIGLGTVQFGMPYGISNSGGQTSDKEVADILKYALSNNVLFIDTASAYGNAEDILGKTNLEPFKVISKFMPPTASVGIEEQLNQSLSKLQIGSLYGYLAHRPTDLLKNPHHWLELERLREENKVGKIGYSLNTVEELITLLDKDMIPDLVQVPYNYFDNRFRHQLIELKSQGCEIHTRSAFLQGLFFMNVDELPVFFAEVKEDIQNLQTEFKESLASVLLKYVLSLDFIDCVIMGVENVQQLSLNITNISEAPIIKDWNRKISDLILMPVNWPSK
ncbi:aldo/keto reductase [Pedobacter insulae]|uniref:Predicted oxidoreductase n=1 Tax=Pedobacter insulae TaxID=414048 RepID=A0A1I2TJ43_9SPHI|nr:aldo/keto reductase [Pedobacter insulae]SFG62516.1 Predicted oxidoreductase [Pedobacter insulae]